MTQIGAPYYPHRIVSASKSLDQLVFVSAKIRARGVFVGNNEVKFWNISKRDIAPVSEYRDRLCLKMILRISIPIRYPQFCFLGRAER